MERGAEAQAATDPSLAQSVAEEDRVTCAAATQPAPGQGGARAAPAAPPEPVATAQLGEALLSVGWTFPADHTASQGQPDYLDGSCLVYAEERLLDVVDFRGAHSAAVGCHSQKASSATYEWSAGRGKAAAVLHSGDVMSAEGGTHVIRVRLADLPACATDCFFAISAYNCRNLSLFRSLNVRLLDAESPTRPLAKLAIGGLAGDVPARASAVVVCALRRRLGVWAVSPLGFACDATVRDYAPVEATIAPLQENHVRWRRRRPLVLLASLWQCGRAFAKEASPAVQEGHREAEESRETEDEDEEDEDDEDEEQHDEEARDLVKPLLKLPAILFQCIVQFI